MLTESNLNDFTEIIARDFPHIAKLISSYQEHTVTPPNDSNNPNNPENVIFMLFDVDEFNSLSGKDHDQIINSFIKFKEIFQQKIILMPNFIQIMTGTVNPECIKNDTKLLGKEINDFMNKLNTIKDSEQEFCEIQSRLNHKNIYKGKPQIQNEPVTASFGWEKEDTQIFEEDDICH